MSNADDPTDDDAADAEDDLEDETEAEIEAVAAIDEDDENEIAAAADREEEANDAVEPVDEEPPPAITEEVLLSMIEALAFSATEPLTASKVREVLGGEELDVPMSDVKQAFSTLMAKWSAPDRVVGFGFRLVEVEGGLAFRTTAVNARWIRRMLTGKPARLSRASLETLSVVAYRQPVTKPQIEEIRGVDCGGAVKALLDRKLVRILGKAEDVGRPLLYGTTRQFLDFFGLATLNELPTLKQLHELEHGQLPTSDVTPEEVQAAVVMDLFNAERVGGLVSKETEEESTEALEALEKALGEAKDVAKKASALVFGLEGTEDEPGPPGSAKPAPQGEPRDEDDAPHGAKPPDDEKH